jgi:hypothetical protein
MQLRFIPSIDIMYLIVQPVIYPIIQNKSKSVIYIETVILVFLAS